MTTVIDGTAGVTFPDLTSQATSGYTGLRNRIINGDMRFDQRNSGSQVTPTTGQYTLDRWVATGTQSGYFTVQQNAGSASLPSGYTNYIGVTSTGAYSLSATDRFSISQRIEGTSIADLGWGTSSAKPLGLSFWAYSSAAGTYGGGLVTDGGRTYVFSYAITAAYLWQYFSLTIPADASAVGTTTATALTLGFGLGAGVTYTGPTSAWSPSTLTQPTSSSGIFAQTGTSLYITGVQLETTSSITPFERRFTGIDLHLCQRYYTLGTGIKTASIFAPGSQTVRMGSVTYPTTMRAAPTVTLSSITYSNSSSLTVDVNQTGFFTTTATATAQGLVEITYSYAADSELT